MAEVIEQVYVRIRPTSVGFREEAATQISRSLAGVQAEATRTGRSVRGLTGDFDHFNRGLILTEARALGLKSVLGGVSAFFIGGAGIATLVHTATAEFSNFTQIGAATNAILTATGHSANVTATGIQALASSIEHKTGIDDEQVKSAENVLLTFRAVRNEVGRGNDVFTRATKASADLSKVFGTDVASTARQLGRALQDPTRGLLTLRRAGLTFTADQVKQIKALADTGQILKAQTLILAEVDRRVGGTAEAVGRTLPGQLNILRERAKDALGDYVKRLSESSDAADTARVSGQALATGFGAVKSAVETLGPPLVTVVKGAHAVESAIGVGPILAAVVGYKALGASVTLAGRAKAIYARATAVATAGNVAEAASTTAVAAAARVEVGSLAGATFALRGTSTAAAGAVAANTAVAASETAVGLAARASAIGLGAGRLALAAVGGPLGAAAIGAGALAAGLFLLDRAARNAAGGIIATRKALDDYNESAKQTKEIRLRVSGARDAIAAARQVRDAAQQALAGAVVRQRTSTAPAGSLEARALAEQVRQARGQLTQATNRLANAEEALANAQADQFTQAQKQPGIISETTKRILEQTAALRSQALGAFGGRHLPEQNDPQTRVIERFIALMDQLRSSGTRADQVVGGALERIAATIHRLPSEKQIHVVLNLAGAGRSVDQILHQLGIGLAKEGEDVATRSADARSQSAAAIGRENAALLQEFEAAQKVLRVEEKKLATRKAAAASARQDAQQARDSVTNALDTLTNANESLAASQRALADAIRSGQDAINSAVRDAKTNLRSIGDTIADAIGRAADAGATRIGPSGPLAAKFKALRDQILAGQGGPDTQRAAQEVAARIQAGQTGIDDTAARAKRRLDDLTDSFNRGRIGAGQFNTGVQRILKDFGLNLRTFGKTFGTAALNDLRDQLTAAKQQAQAIAAGPQRPGGGGAPNIVRPLEAVAAAQRDTRDATKNVERATRDVAKAQRDLQQKQIDEQRKSRLELQAIRKAVEQSAKVAKDQAKLTAPKPKPTGNAGKTAQQTTTTGGGAP